MSSSSVRWPILRLKLMSLSTSCSASGLASSMAARALFSPEPTFVLRCRIFDQRASSGTKKVYLSGLVELRLR